jgi:acyl-CoA synthetase (AMP-forming)/AMP-acid ligase II
MRTIGDVLREATRTGAERVAVIDRERRLTFAELGARCARLGGSLRALGLERGDRVAILAGNRHEYLEAYVGVPAFGFVIVPLNTRHALPELEYAVRDSGARALLTDRSPEALAHYVERVIVLGDEYESLLAAAATSDGASDSVSAADLAGLFYTGGTTGASKGVMLSHGNLVANARHWHETVPQCGDDVYLLAAPLFHAAGSNGVLASLAALSTQVALPAFEPSRALELIATHRVTQTLVVPTMLAALAEEQLRHPRDARTIRVIAHGGSPIATEVLRRSAQAFPGAELVELYGATELAPLATALRNEQRMLDLPRIRSCGRAVPGAQVRVVDAEGRALPAGTIGEIAVRGPNVMLGYWNKPVETAAALREDEYRTGDLGYVDDEGYLYLVDRCKDMIVTGGENVYCTEVEDALYRHPAVLEAAVFGVPHEQWGEAVHAVVVLRTEHGDAATIAREPRALIDFCRERIAPYKAPKSIEVRAEPLPKSGPGKVLKRELRAPWWAGRARGVN